MSVQELEENVAQLSRPELSAFARWFEEYLADEWDRQIEEDARSGRLDKLMQDATDDIKAGRFTPL